MANLLSTFLRRTEVSRFSLTEYLAQIANGWGGFGSSVYSVGGKPVEKIPTSYASYAEAAYCSSSVVGACMRVRRDIFRQARFTWRELTDDGTGMLLHDAGLTLLDRPWPNGTTGELLAKMITDVDLCGNSFIVNDGDRLRWRRPDWMYIVLTGDPRVDDDVDVFGYVYSPGGIGIGEGKPYLVQDVCHWSPIPMPGAEYVGMSWMTSALRDVQGDKAATEHKLAFFDNGATLGPIYTLPATLTAEQFKKFREGNEAAHTGPRNAYKAQYIGGGATVSLTASTFQQLELKATQGANETRIAAAAGVHPAIVGLSEGLAGSTLNSGNFQAARRLVSDVTLMPLWQDACAALAAFVEVPGGYELWIRERAIPFLREDAKDAADIAATEAETVTKLVREGFTSDSSVAATTQRNMGLLEHSGLTSVQLQPPGTGVDETVRALALVGERELSRRFNPRQPRDTHGRWSLTAAAVDALKALGGTQGHVDLDPDDPDGRYFDWSSYNPDAGTYSFEAGLEGDAVALDLDDQDMTRLFNALSLTQLRDEGGSNHPTSLAAMLAAGDQNAVNFSGDKGYADWSRRGPDGSYHFELGDEDGNAVQMELTPAELARLAASLALSTQTDGPIPDQDESVRALVWALGEICRSDWNPADHPRNPRGGPGGGRFRSVAARILDALEAWAHGDGDDDAVLKDFTQPQLRKAVQARGLTPKPRGTAADLRKQLLDDVREKISGRVTSGTPDKPDPLSDDPDVRAVQLDNRVRAAYRDLRKPGEWVGLADLREHPELGDLTRDEQDEALAGVIRFGDAYSSTRGNVIRLIPVANRKALTDRDRAAAVQVGGDDQHAILFDDPSPRPLPSKTPAKKATPEAPDKPDLDALRQLDDPEAIRDALDLHKVPELQTMLGAAGLKKSGRKRELVDRLVEHIHGGKADAPRKATALDLSEVAAQLTTGLSESDAIQRLSSDTRLTAARLREVADGLGIEIPSNMRAKSAILLHIAEKVGSGQVRPAPDIERIRVAHDLRVMSDLIGNGFDAHDNQTAQKLDRLVAGLRDGSLSDAYVRDQLAALADEYPGSASGDNLRNWSRTLDRLGKGSAHTGAAAAEEKARARQADIDHARGFADVAGELDELLNNGADPAVVLRGIDSVGRRGGLTSELKPIRDAIESEARQVEVENRIREAYREARASIGRDSLIPLAGIRDRLPDLDRVEVDAALIRMARTPGGGVLLTPNEDRKRITPRDRDAELKIPLYGAEDPNHWLTIDDPSPRTADMTDARSLMDDLLKSKGVRQVGKAGDSAHFDRAAHEAMPGIRLRDGAAVEVVRPGFVLSRDGEDIRLSKPIVEEVDAPAKVATAKRVAREGDAALAAVPVSATFKGAANMDQSTWSAAGFEGLPNADRGAVAAVTKYLRAPWFANQRLRSPGEPLHDQSMAELSGGPVDVEKAAKAAALADRHIAALDRVMDQSRLSAPVVTYRGVRLKALGDLPSDPVGHTWNDPGFTSTSADRSVAEHSFAGRGAALLRITAPEGTPALGLEGLGESEILLGRGLTYRVVADHGLTPEGARHLDVEVVPVTQFSSVENAGDLPGWITESTEDGEALRAAGGHDITSGNDQLHLYWTRGEGLAKWFGHPHPWTTLRNHLEKHVGRERANRMASQWYHEVTGHWIGEEKGHNPVGPG